MVVPGLLLRVKQGDYFGVDWIVGDLAIAFMTITTRTGEARILERFFPPEESV